METDRVSTAFVQWAKIEVEKYAEMFRKQVYSLDVDPEVIDAAMRVTKLQSRKVSLSVSCLSHVG